MFSGSMQISQEQTGIGGGGNPKQQECSGCKKSIIDRYLLKALDQYWHEDCLKCSCCDCRLGEVGSTLFAKANLLLCRRDYLRYGTLHRWKLLLVFFPKKYKHSLGRLHIYVLFVCNMRGDLSWPTVVTFTGYWPFCEKKTTLHKLTCFQ